MASGHGGGVIGPIEQLFRRGTVAALGNGPLLERFAARRDEAAFEALVGMHGPMVLGVCRRLLADPHDVEDAFQATFLVLARRAGSIRRPDLLAPWLHGVARRVAVRARARTARRWSREQPGADLVALARTDPDADRHELGSVLDEEIGRLPEKYRRPVVLCYLEGRTQEEAARDLRWTPGTVRGRLAKARDLLRSRMTRRGLCPTGGALGAILPFESASSAVPPQLAAATARSAIVFAAGRAAAAGAVPASASALARGVLTTMFLTRWKFLTPVLLTVAGAIALPLAIASEPEKPPAAPPEKAAAVNADVSPQQIMARLVKTYADAKSYQDEGVVTLVFNLPTGKNTQKKPFSTKFVRPKLYRYEFTEPTGFEEPKRYVIWSDAAPARARTWWTVQPKVREETLDLAINTAAGVSNLSSLTIPALLMPAEIQAQNLKILKDLKTVGEASVDGAPCTKVEGKDSRGGTYTVWIDKKTSLVRKLHNLSKLPGDAVEPKVPPFTVETTTTYRPRLNVEIDPKEFAFEPPKS